MNISVRRITFNIRKPSSYTHPRLTYTRDMNPASRLGTSLKSPAPVLTVLGLVQAGLPHTFYRTNSIVVELTSVSIIMHNAQGYPGCPPSRVHRRDMVPVSADTGSEVTSKSKPNVKGSGNPSPRRLLLRPEGIVGILAPLKLALALGVEGLRLPRTLLISSVYPHK